MIVKYDVDGPTIEVQCSDQPCVYDPSVRVVILQYYIMRECGWGNLTTCRD